MKKQMLVIHTGGTISMAEDKKTGTVKPRKTNLFVEKTKDYFPTVDLLFEGPFNLPSPHITPKEMCKIKQLIEERVRKNHIDGVVITHGTDTLEETSYFLDLTLNLSIPVVVTGAMRSSNEIGSDGLYNFISSLRVAACEEAKDKGVLVVLNDEIHAAKNVTKTHTSNISTFQSPQFGPIGIITKRKIIFHHKPLFREYYDINDVFKKVILIKAHAGMDSALFLAAKDFPCDGVVVEALGQGNLPPSTLPGVTALINNGIPIVLVSRCFNGIVQDTYEYAGGGKELKELGVIFSNGLNGQKARLKLLLALNETNDLNTLQEIFQL